MCEEKNQSFLEADTIVFGGHNLGCLKYPKQQLFAIFSQYLKKEGRHEADFLHTDKKFCKLILSIWVTIASLAQSTRDNKFAKSLQYLEKEVRDDVDFCREKLQGIQKVGTVILMGAARHT